MTGELRTITLPYAKTIGAGLLDGLPHAQAIGVGVDDFALYTALRELRRASGFGAGNYLVSWPWNLSMIDASLYPPLTNQRLMMVPQLVPPGQAIDGVYWVQQVAGVYTAVNTNGVACYSATGAGAVITWTRLAQGTNANIWKAATGGNVQAFGAQVPASSSWRILWACGLWNQSAVTTVPTIGGDTVGGGGIGAVSPGLGALAFQVDNGGQINFPASFTSAAVTAGDTNHHWLAFYRNYT